MTKKTAKEASPPIGEVEITPEDAQKVLQDKRQERVRAVEQGIQDLCAHHRCVIDIQFTLSLYGKPEGRLVVMPRD
jgi:hypothetical protein